MNLASVMDALGAALDTIPGLRAHPYYAGSVTPPAAVVGWPDTYDFDQTMQRGSDQVVMPVTVIVGKADARSSRDRLAQYVAGSGGSSVKATIESFASDAYDSARVKSADFGTVNVAGSDYLSATFDIEIYAPGEVT